MRSLITISLLCAMALGQLPDAPQPHLATVRPAVEAGPADEPKPHHVWLHRGVEVGSCMAAGKFADDAFFDNPEVLGTRKALAADAGVFGTCWLIEHHYLWRRHAK